MEECTNLSKRCKSLNEYDNLKIEIDREQKLMRKFKKMLELKIEHQPTKTSLEKAIVESKENIIKNKKILKELKNEINCK